MHGSIDITEASAFEQLRQPFRQLANGSFFSPSHALALAGHADFEQLGYDTIPLLMRVRHLPTREVIAAVEAAYGDPAGPLCTRWRKIWQRLVGDIETFASRVGYLPAPEHPFPENALRRSLKEISAGQAYSHDANLLEAVSYFETSAARRFEQHALEDARVVTELAGQGLHVGYAVQFSNAPVIVGLSPKGRRFQRNPTKKAWAEIRRGFTRANAYWNLPSFIKTIDRTMIEAVGTRHLGAILADMAGQGHERAFLKDAAFKGGTWVVDLASVTTPVEALHACMKAMGMSFVRFAERGAQKDEDAKMIVQEFRPFQKEHRFFCVGGRIVASTASHRTSTILDAPQTRLDPHVAVLDRPACQAGPFDRGASSLVKDRSLVAGMALRVRKLLRAMREDEFALTFLADAFVIDVGICDGSIDIIEINTFRNAGLYGVDYGRIAKALAADWKWTDSRKALRLRLARLLEEVGFSKETSSQTGRGRQTQKSAPMVFSMGNTGGWGLVPSPAPTAGSEPK